MKAVLGCVGQQAHKVVLLYAGGGDGGGEVGAGEAGVVALLLPDCLSVSLIAVNMIIRKIHNDFPLSLGGQTSPGL